MSAIYEDLLVRLAERQTAGMAWGLDRVRAALARLGDPHERVAAVQIAGTNGKGSTAAMTASILRAGGFKVGLYTSPHLCRFSERFRLDGAEVDAQALARVGHRVLDLDVPLSYFEAATAMAFLLFAEAGVELAVLETGMGGRLDATTVCRAVATAITSVALDHTDVLGTTLAAIAREKAAIARPGVPLALGALPPEAEAAVRAVAHAAGAVFLPIAPLPEGLAPGLRGAHQLVNASVAAALAHAAMRALGRALPSAAVAEGLATANVRWPGRLEVLRAGKTRVVLDGAHNAEGAEALAAWLVADAEPPARRALVISVAADKRLGEIVAPLAPLFGRVFATRSRNPRALGPEVLAAAFPSAVAAVAVSDAAAAISVARAAVGPGGTVVVAGSLFLVGEARAHLLSEPMDVVPIFDPVGPKFAGHGTRS